MHALAGTAAAYERCEACGHARIRHDAGGTGRCASWDYRADPSDKAGHPLLGGPCICPAYTEPNGEH